MNDVVVARNSVAEVSMDYFASLDANFMVVLMIVQKVDVVVFGPFLDKQKPIKETEENNLGEQEHKNSFVALVNYYCKA